MKLPRNFQKLGPNRVFQRTLNDLGIQCARKFLKNSYKFSWKTSPKFTESFSTWKFHENYIASNFSFFSERSSFIRKIVFTWQSWKFPPHKIFRDTFETYHKLNFDFTGKSYSKKNPNISPEIWGYFSNIFPNVSQRKPIVNIK